ncbi:MAG TPA: hypothetical protein PLR28_06765 [Dokdonella sp.]|nr:hypothetical protein [Dokdonella sp.]
MSLGYFLAWLLPWFAGTGICLAVGGGVRDRGGLAGAAGSGFLLGLFLAAGISCLVASSDTANAFSRAAPWLAAIAMLAWLAAVVFRGSVFPALLPAPMHMGRRLIWWILLLAIFLRLDVLFDEALLRPTFPWDAWSAWAVKPKSWFLLGHHVPYESMQQWLAPSATEIRTAGVWNYPELLAWVQIWFASAAGGWNEPLINAAWTGVLGALGLASYGHWRVLGIRPGLAMLLTYGLLSLPLLDAHAALAGYADLWLAAVFGMAVLSWLRWLQRREAGQLLLALVFAGCMPLIKLEGAVWLLAFSVILVLNLLPRRWRWMLVAVVGGLACIGIALGGFPLPVIGLGWVHMAWAKVDIPLLGTLDLYWRPVGSEMLSVLFTLPNWHLLWYVLPLVVVLRRRVLVAERAAGLVGLLLLACASFLFVLFFFTDASAWAENFTSSNRLILHLVPVVFSLLALLLADVRLSGPDRSARSIAPTAEG